MPPVPVAVWLDPAKLLEIARKLVEQPSAGRPRAISLRRAISSAYYALFHELCDHAVKHLLPNGARSDQLRLSRSFAHGELKVVCEFVGGRKTGGPRHAQPVIKALATSTVGDVASAFCDLQEARHAADYDHLAPFSKATALAAIQDADDAIQRLRVAPTGERQAFLALLTLKARLH